MSQLTFFCSMQGDWWDVFWQWAGCAWTTSSFLFCSSWHQQSSSKAVLCVIFWTSFAVLRTWIGKFWFFFSSGETHHLTNAVFSIHLSDYFCPFLPQGVHFVPVIRLLFPDQSWRAGVRTPNICTTQQWSVRLCLILALFYTCTVESAHTWVLLSPPLGREWMTRACFWMCQDAVREKHYVGAVLLLSL